MGNLKKDDIFKLENIANTLQQLVSFAHTLDVAFTATNSKSEFVWALTLFTGLLSETNECLQALHQKLYDDFNASK